MSLPMELLLVTIDITLPTRTNFILRPSDSITQSLWTWSLVCCETRKLLKRHLVQHCVYIEGRRQSRSLLRKRDEHGKFPGVKSLFLYPYTCTFTGLTWETLLKATAHSLVRLVIEFSHAEDARSLNPTRADSGFESVLSTISKNILTCAQGRGLRLHGQVHLLFPFKSRRKRLKRLTIGWHEEDRAPFIIALPGTGNSDSYVSLQVPRAQRTQRA